MLEAESSKRGLLLSEAGADGKTAASIPTAQAAPVTGATANYDQMIGMEPRRGGNERAAANPPEPISRSSGAQVWHSGMLQKTRRDGTQNCEQGRC